MQSDNPTVLSIKKVDAKRANYKVNKLSPLPFHCIHILGAPWGGSSVSFQTLASVSVLADKSPYLAPVELIFNIGHLASDHQLTCRI